MASSVILPHTFVALRTPSGQHRVLKIAPDTTISLGKFGSFDTNALLGRPYYLTYEISDVGENKPASTLRVVPAQELHADVLAEDDDTPPESRADTGQGGAANGELESETAGVLIRNNRLTIDDSTRQALSMEEIEQLKKASTGSGKDIVEQILKSHSALDEKTAFSLAKYTQRKNRKYMKRFTALPLNVSVLTKWMVEEKEPARVMELREEHLGLIASWSNVHYGGLDAGLEHLAPNGRILIVDDTGGLVVAAVAEHMGILHAPVETTTAEDDPAEQVEDEAPITGEGEDEAQITSHITGSSEPVASQQAPRQHRKPRKYPPDAMSAVNNTITVIHAATQPNVSMLTYFSYNPTDTSSKSALPSTEHPLHTHLKTVSFLQLTNPSADGSYVEPEVFPDEEIATWKSGQRGNYFRKRRRWERTKRVVDETRAGGFDALIVASSLAPATVLHHTVPLLKGGGQVVVYHPHVEPLTELADLYSSSRKTALLNEIGQGSEVATMVPSQDFPLDPRLLLAPTLQTARAKEWQVLPGRTHPLMTSRGGAEGYLFTGTRVIPAEGKVEARGRFAKKKKVASDDRPLAKKARFEPQDEQQVEVDVEVEVEQHVGEVYDSVAKVEQMEE